MHKAVATPYCLILDNTQLPNIKALRGVSILAGNDAICRPSLPVHLAEVADKPLRSFVGRKVPALLVFALEDELAYQMRPSTQLMSAESITTPATRT